MRARRADGTWDGRWGTLRTGVEFEGSLVLVTARPEGGADEQQVPDLRLR